MRVGKIGLKLKLGLQYLIGAAGSVLSAFARKTEDDQPKYMEDGTLKITEDG